MARKGKKRGGGLIALSAVQQAQAAGCGLVAIALLTLLSFFSFSRGLLTEGWLQLLRQIFGWGAYLMPVGLGALGIWLLRRYASEEQEERWEKPLGMVLLYAVSLALIHLFTPTDDPAATAAAGNGGGYVGWAISELLISATGWIGAVVVTIALLSIALVMVSSLSLAEIPRHLRHTWERLYDWYLLHLRPIRVSRPVQEEGLPERILNKVWPPSATPQTEAQASQSRLGSAEVFPRLIGGQEWRLPTIDQILDDASEQDISQQEIRLRVKIIEETLQSFGVPAKVVEVNQGPTVTQFGVEPGFVERRDSEGRVRRAKIKISKISALTNDLALALAASPIRIEAPVPGRSVVGIEVPNVQANLVSLRSVIESEAFRELKSRLKIALGQDVAGQAVVADLATMPHLLIAGATGSGKSVCVNSIVACLLCHNTPDELRFLMIDPKMVELTNFNGIPHLLAPVVVDLERVVGVLYWATKEMDRRYRLFAKAEARNVEGYNEMQVARGEKPLPYIIIVIDELADLMLLAPDEVERHICRIAQMARATGLHLVIATQRPSVDVVTGLIKANFPARISFAVTSQVDSRVILDAGGAEQLLGRGDMLYMASDSSKLIRLQGCFVSDRELTRLVRYWKEIQALPREEMASGQEKDLLGPSDLDGPLVQQPLWSDYIARAQEAAEDNLLEKAIEIVRSTNRASVSLLQRRLRIGYSRAARIIDLLEDRGIVGPDPGGGRARQVLQQDDASEDDWLEPSP